MSDNFKLALLGVAVVILLTMLVIQPGSTNNQPIRHDRDVIFTMASEQTEEAWSFVNNKFKSPYEIENETLDVIPANLTLTDYYYDTNDLLLANDMRYLRFRIVTQPDGKSIVRIEFVSASTTGINRGLAQLAKLNLELDADRFSATPPVDGQSLLDRLSSTSQEALLQQLNELGVTNISEIKADLKVQENRRRLSFKQAGNEILSIAVDVSTGEKDGRTSKDFQLAVQPNYRLFAESSEEDQQKFLNMEEQIVSIIKDRFKNLVQTDMLKVDRLHIPLIKK